MALKPEFWKMNNSLPLNISIRLVLLVLLGFGLNTGLNAKVRFIDLLNELKEADFVQEVEILGYADTLMLYRIPGTADTLRQDCRIRGASESFRERMKAHAGASQAICAGQWPAEGETVLMVVKDARVRLFARRQGDVYRFWDPLVLPFANSVFRLSEKDQVLPLPDCQSTSSRLETAQMCPDGCLFPIVRIRKK